AAILLALGEPAGVIELGMGIDAFFPYTTLFRSPSFLRLARDESRPKALRSGAAFWLSRGAQAKLGVSDADHDDEDDVRGSVVFADRKSTRLNSSHVAISYAVFCLKKKTRTPLSRWPRRASISSTLLNLAMAIISLFRFLSLSPLLRPSSFPPTRPALT